MSKKSKAPLPKGQRSIASFVFKKDDNDDLIASSGGAPATNSAEDIINLVDEDEPHPTKRPRQEKNNTSNDNNAISTAGNAAPPKSKTSSITPHVEAEARHQRWQSKLVGDESAGMQRVRTQEALEQRKDTSAAAGPSTVKMTPLELQVAALQRQHPECVLAIECGYKYRFFGKDAEIASAVLGIFSYPDRNYLTAAVPTFTVDKHVRRLVLAGHKVGIVRQTESAAIKAAGDNKNKPFERKLATIMTKATIEAGALAAGRPLTAAAAAAAAKSAATSGGWNNEDEDEEEGAATAAAVGRVEDAAYGNENNSAFLVCIVEGRGGGSTSPHTNTNTITNTTNTTNIGLVALEMSTGEVYYSQFSDSPMRAELESRLMFTNPSEILLITPLSSPTRRLLEAYGSTTSTTTSTTGSGGFNGSNNNGPVRTETVSGDKMSSAADALSTVVDFYKSNETSPSSSGLDAVMKLPPLVVRALAHALEYLRPYKLESILRLGATFQEFSEIQELSLSPNALTQLEILRNSDDGKEKGSLLWLMDRTLTKAGSRLVRRWVSRPLRDVGAIKERLDAVEELVNNSNNESKVLDALPGVLKELPDLERILGRVFYQTSSPTEFLLLLEVFRNLYLKLGLQADLDAVAVALYGSGEADGKDQPVESNGDMQAAIPFVSVPPSEASSTLLRRELAAAADLRCAAVAQSIIASLNVDAAASGDKLNMFSDAVRFADVEEKKAAVVAVETELDNLRPQLAQILNLKAVNYVSIANQGDYLVEIPVDLEKRAPKTWEKVSSTKKFIRFRPPEVKRCLAELVLAKEYLAITANKAWIRLQTEFAQQHFAVFKRATRALATLDCLHSFAALAVGSAGSYVRPEFVDDETAQLHITEGRHPVLDILLEGSFVPNDIHLQGSSRDGDGGRGGRADGDDFSNMIVEEGNEGNQQQLNPVKERCAVITGPNMGGKSCYIRQAALIAIMAQCGSFVPATTCRLHAFDAIYTRMGAADNLALGRSTFLEELGEASTILANATPYSLVIFDELGRGTSTQDGKAIAGATLEYVCSKIQCLTLFVTHYPEVALQSKDTEGMGSYYMAHIVDEENGDDEELDGKEKVPKVTFLYKAVKGVAEASYGLNVARMAGLPESVVVEAAQKAREMAAAAALGGGDGSNGGLERVAGEVVAKLREIEHNGGAVVDARVVRQLQKQVENALIVS
jgi:DNA mismatch repair protein MSH3